MSIIPPKQDSPSAQRNKEPIWQFLSSEVLTSPGSSKDYRVLEVATGAGVHTDYFAPKFAEALKDKSCSWYPSDPEQESLDSIQCYINDGNLGSIVKPPCVLTLDENGIMEKETTALLDGLEMDLMICINMIHISPWEATLGLLQEASKRLSDTGCLYCYGPYRENGTAVESNIKFEGWLKSKDERFGLRDLEKVVNVAEENGLKLVKKIEMPANNLSLVFQKASAAQN
ncbi:unnamed protein product [Cylindrotheca closterium]|uniref:DUF938 domain-containing protein n=1 Tax=Cylindrotheca closterium TaxID=2856 RepID=A0AAD2CFZ6_9STRA|nr:unnamed protein product [Cylindrotheca closterium]